MKDLHARGVYEVVQPEFEASLEFTRQALLHFEFPPDKVQSLLDAIRYELYAPLYDSDSSYGHSRSCRALPGCWNSTGCC
jgi:CPA2 family monovalent cation:H+ antiporter-2